MYFADHNPPHFHAKYGEYRASFEITTGKLLSGDMPKTATKLIEQWRKLYYNELLQSWDKAKSSTLPDKINPLD